ncbi:hypothetical protein OESDEN_10467, partial [Oesophagostomum dentatum]
LTTPIRVSLIQILRSIFLGHPLATCIDQWTSLHHITRKAVERSKAAYASIAITKRLTL